MARTRTGLLVITLNLALLPLMLSCGPGPPVVVDSIHVDEDGVRCFVAGQPGAYVRWSQLVRAEVRTVVSDNYMQPYYTLLTADGERCEFRSELGNHAHVFLDRLGRLPGCAPASDSPVAGEERGGDRRHRQLKDRAPAAVPHQPPVTGCVVVDRRPQGVWQASLRRVTGSPRWCARSRRQCPR